MRGRYLGLAGRSPLVELIRSRSGLEGVVGDEEAEEVKKEAGLRFFLSIVGEVSGTSFTSCTGVKLDNDGRKIVKLFRRLLSYMTCDGGSYGEVLEAVKGHSRPRSVGKSRAKLMEQAP